MAKESGPGTRQIERIFEKFLWRGRIVILLAVGCLLVGALVVFLVGALETASLVAHAIEEVRTHGLGLQPEFYNNVLVNVITLVDILLIGIALLIFGMGTYDLFISRLEPAKQQDDIRSDWFIFDSLDALKDKLGKVVIVILVITFLKSVVHVEFTEPIELLWLGGGICLVALGLMFHSGKTMKKSGKPAPGDDKDD